MEVLGRGSWPDRFRTSALPVALSTFGILALELALIRWTSSQIRIFAYFNNIVLICAFLGMGAGVAVGKRRPAVAHLTLPLALVLAGILAFSQELSLMQMSFPDKSVSLWGGEVFSGTVAQYARSMSIFLGLVTLVVLVFLAAGASLGALFPRLPPLRAYSADLAGSLAGVLVFAGCTMTGAGPLVWLALAVAPFVILSRTVLAAVSAALICALAAHSEGDAVFSPYNRIDLDRSAPPTIMLSVNRDFHQFMHDLSDRALSDPAVSQKLRQDRKFIRQVYDLPFTLPAKRGSAVVVGAGTGNDVQAALRNGFQVVHSVDIDPEILRLGQQLHPEGPYRNPAAVRVNDDARAFFERYRGEPFDVVCYGLLDSHAMFSSMSSLRLDNFVYTEEGIRSAFRHVAPDGYLTVSFSVYAGQWIFDRLYYTIRKATGTDPVAVYHGMHYGATFVVPRTPGRINAPALAAFGRLEPSQAEEEVRTTSDNWPFLYLRPGTVPASYLAVLAFLLLAGVGLTVGAFGRQAVGSDFHPALFLMGAAFLLLETRGVTTVSLLFGSTWAVNAAIFGSVLLVVLVANLWVSRRPAREVGGWFFGLFAMVLAVTLFDNAWISHWPLAVRGTLGALINIMPIGIAGIIVPVLLARAANPAAALGSNLLGSVVGGCLEYLSMWTGLRTLGVLALLLYVAAFLLQRRGAGRGPAGQPSGGA